MNQDFKKILKDFVQKAKSVEEAIKHKFDFTESPYSLAGKTFKKKGEIVNVNTKEVKIWYHGSGCTFTFPEGIELNYSIAPITANSIKISPWSIYKFIETSNRYNCLSQKEILEYYEKLEKEGILSRYLKGYDFFEICESWVAENVEVS